MGALAAVVASVLQNPSGEIRQLHALGDEIRRVLDANPDLTVDGWRCPFTDGDRCFAQRREEALWPDFTVEVKAVLETLAVSPRRCHLGREFAELSAPRFRLGATIVAVLVAGVPFRRIPGSPDIEISRRGRT